tara:strand:+ start:522 stop:1682 length:1161 start_codon:yes stop_codon:yes gene_type:complete
VLHLKVAVIDLFCGMGGFSQGAIEAGAKVVLAVDLWEEALLVHAKNHPDTPIKRMTLGEKYHFSLFKREVEKWRKLGYHVHIHGSPPCQALSNASSRNPEEGMPLVIWFLDCVKFADPDSWSMENVVPVRKRLPEGTPSVILNSADFGVAQTRRRCFAGEGWVAKPTHAKKGSAFVEGQTEILWEWLGVIDVLPHLNELLEDNLVIPINRRVGWMNKTAKQQKPRYLKPIWREIDEPIQTITTSRESIGKLVINTDGATNSNSRRANSVDSDIDKPVKTLHRNKPTIRQFKLEALGSNANRKNDREISQPSKTICGSGNQTGARIFNHTEPKPEKIRSLTIEETLILQGFNPDYDMTAANTQKARWTMIGNAVVPAVAKAVIQGII